MENSIEEEVEAAITELDYPHCSHSRSCRITMPDDLEYWFSVIRRVYDEYPFAYLEFEIRWVRT